MGWGYPSTRCFHIHYLPVLLIFLVLFAGANMTNDTAPANETGFVNLDEFLNITNETQSNETTEEFVNADEFINLTEPEAQNETFDLPVPPEQNETQENETGFVDVDELINETEEEEPEEFIEVGKFLNTTSEEPFAGDAFPGEGRESQFRLIDSRGISLDATIQILKNGKEVPAAQGSHTLTALGVSPGEYDIAITPLPPPNDSKEGLIPIPVSQVLLKDVQLDGESGPSLRMQGIPPFATPFGKNTKQAFAIDPTDFEFSEGEITLVSKGTELYKCAEWNYDEEACEGKWIKVMDVAPGEEFTITIGPDDPAYAVYSAASGTPRCTTTESPCIAGSSLLYSRDSISFGGEPNQPNTIDSCTDGSSGWYTNDESVENITIESLTAPMDVFNGGDLVRVTAWFYCWNTGAADNINLAYANSTDIPSWRIVNATDSCPGGGLQMLSGTFHLDDRYGEHAIRVMIQYDGDTSDTCGTGNYDDNDDLAFQVNGTPSTITLISPMEGATTNGGIVPFSFNTSESASCTLLIDGHPDQGSMAAMPGTTYIFNASPLSGTHTWAVQCDAITSETRAFTQPSDKVILETTFISGGTFNPDGDNRAPWERGDATQVGGCHLDSSCWGTNLAANYDANGPYSDYLRLRVAQTMNFSGYQNVILTFYQYRYFENAATLYDGGVIDIRNYTNAWARVTPEGGYSGIVDDGYSNPLADQEAFGYHSSDWELVVINLSDYDESEAMRFRFYFGADNSVNDRGWFIDDVRVFGEHSNLTTGCFAASIPGATYTLDSDLVGTKADSACITVDADDITIDCSGHSITGDHTPGTLAIVAQSVENLKIVNCTISNYTYGVVLNSTSHSSMENISIENTEHGFHIEGGSSYNAFTNNNVHDQVRCAFTLYNSTHNLFEHNVVTNASSAMYMYPGSDYNTILSNDLYENSDSGIYLNGSSYNLIENNVIYSSKYAYNIHYGSDYNNLTNNLAYNTSDAGFEITYSMHNRFVDNIARNNALRGFWTVFSSYNVFINNTAHGNDLAGFSLSVLSSYNILERNRAYNNTDVGFRIVYNSTHNNLTDNEAYENDLNGIWIYSTADYNLFQGNQVHDNGHYGVISNQSAFNSFVNNDIHQNFQYGVYLEASSYNNFTGGTVHGNDVRGFSFEGGSHHNRIISVAANENMFSSLSIEDSSGTYVDPSYFCNSTIGINISNANDTVIDDSVACNNSLYGIYIQFQQYAHQPFQVP